MTSTISLTYIANARFPSERAHGIQIAKMSEALVKAGANLELIVPSKKTNIKENPFEAYGIKNIFPVKKIWTVNLMPSTRTGFLSSSFFFGVSTFFYLIFNRGTGIIYSIDLDPLSFLGFIFLGRKCFFEIHGPKKDTFLNRILFRNAEGIIAINESVKNNLENNFSNLKGKIIVFPNGVDVDNIDYKGGKESARRHLKLSKDKKIAVYTGSFQAWKGIETIMKGAKITGDILFYLVGGSIEEAKKLEGVNNIPDNVYIMGLRDYKEMPLWLSSADVLIVTGTKRDDYSFYYTSPMKLFEYMAANRPIVASRTPAIEQVVSDSEVFFHQPDDADDFAEKVKYIFFHSKIADEKTKMAFSMAKKLSWKNRADKVLEFVSRQ